MAGADEVRRLGEDACLVYTPLSPAELRDVVRDQLDDGESALVFEFEKWSGCGVGVDRKWLLALGH